MTLFRSFKKRTPPNTPLATEISQQPALRSCVRRFAILLLLTAPYVYAANQPPIANAGSNQSIGTNSLAQLNGLRSFDSDGSIKSYLWKQLKGQKIKLSNSKLANPTFKTPAKLPVEVLARRLIFKLTVSDNKNRKASATVTINLISCNAPQILINNSCQNPVPVCYPPKQWQNGECLLPSPPPSLTCTAPLTLINGRCALPPVVCSLPEMLQNGACAVPGASATVNDTGITLCSDQTNNGDFCPVSNDPGQDAEFGRDKLFNDDNDGHAGFSFVKLDANGAELPVSATDWSCVKDNVTGLIWEHKTADGGLRDKDHLYSNYGADFDPIAEYQASTDASGYVNAINATSLCGGNDWRLPSIEELQGIVDFGVQYPGPAIDSGFFTNTVNREYWASTLYSVEAAQGWVVYFDDGRIFRDHRDQHYRVRVVRDSRSTLNR